MSQQAVLSDVSADFGNDLGQEMQLEHFVPTHYTLELRSEEGMDVMLSLANQNISDDPFDAETGTIAKFTIPHMKTVVEMPKLQFGENKTVGTIHMRFRSDEAEIVANPRSAAAQEEEEGK